MANVERTAAIAKTQQYNSYRVLLNFVGMLRVEVHKGEVILPPERALLCGVVNRPSLSRGGSSGEYEHGCTCGAMINTMVREVVYSSSTGIPY